MEIVFHFKSENFAKAKEMMLTDDVVNRSSLIFKEGSTIGKEDYYCYMSGTDEQCRKASELIKDLAEEVEGQEKNEIIKKIKEEEDKAIQGFGDILG